MFYFRYNVVPVVYGGANYSRFAPPKSYVNALDFDSPKELAAHLKRLSENLDEYQRYFEWKNYYEIDSSKKPTICRLCEFLNNDEQIRDQLEVQNWYNVKKQCSLQNKLDKQRYDVKGNSYVTKKWLS